MDFRRMAYVNTNRNGNQNKWWPDENDIVFSLMINITNYSLIPIGLLVALRNICKTIQNSWKLNEIFTVTVFIQIVNQEQDYVSSDVEATKITTVFVFWFVCVCV